MSSEVEVRFVGDMERLEIKPGDRFVLSLDREITREVSDRIHRAWEVFAGPSAKLIILAPGMKLSGVYDAEPAA